ncbi:MAG: hypothetical protein MK212_22370, partial [Saprospiraceae bacterium]|nr:hypothetical protein [Saprospiraceae bacterium]
SPYFYHFLPDTIQPPYHCYPASRNAVVVKQPNQAFKVLDNLGNPIFDQSFSGIKPSLNQEGLLVLYDSKYWGLMTTSMDTLLPFEYTTIELMTNNVVRYKRVKNEMWQYQIRGTKIDIPQLPNHITTENLNWRVIQLGS